VSKELLITVSIKDEDGKTIMVRETASPYDGGNPDADVGTILSAKTELAATIGAVSRRELDKFVAKAKEQGTNMPFDDMEAGILAAGRKDMQNGLSEILDSLKFDKPDCPECGEGMNNRGREKKTS